MILTEQVTTYVCDFCGKREEHRMDIGIDGVVYAPDGMGLFRIEGDKCYCLSHKRAVILDGQVFYEEAG